MSKSRIGGYVVLTHGGSDETDWQYVSAILPEKPDAETFVKDQIGATNIKHGMDVQRKRDEERGYQGTTRYEFGSVHAVSPKYLKQIQTQLMANQDSERYWIAEAMLDGHLHESFQLKGEKVICTEQEVEVHDRHARFLRNHQRRAEALTKG